MGSQLLRFTNIEVYSYRNRKRWKGTQIDVGFEATTKFHSSLKFTQTDNVKLLLEDSICTWRSYVELI